MAIESINPANGERLKSYRPLTRDEAITAVVSAHEAFAAWRHRRFGERKEIALRFAAALRDQKEELARLITTEMGKRISEARSEIEFCAEITEFYANGAERFLAERPMDLEGVEAFVRYEPLGVLLGVMPWNFPFYQVVRFAIPNMMAGNTVLIRHASNVPQCSERVQSMLSECGLPDGVFANLLIPTEFCEPIISREEVRGVSLTGSEKAGASVAALAGKYLKPSVLELGGNDAFIVLDDADLEAAVGHAVRGRMVNTGQSCVAAKRFILCKPIAGDFISKFRDALAALKMGDPMDEETEVGPLSSERAASGLLEDVQASVDAGATVLLGGDRPHRDGAYFNPTILTGVKPGMPTYDKELFGPVASIYIAEDENAAIAMANDSSYGLGGSVFTSDPERGRRVAERVETGMMFVNQPTNSQAELPFGGIKKSGYGRELSELGIMEFVNKKLVHLG